MHITLQTAYKSLMMRGLLIEQPTETFLLTDMVKPSPTNLVTFIFCNFPSVYIVLFKF